VSGPVALVYGDELMKHHLSDEHPLQPIRVKLTMDLIKSTGLIEHCHLLPPRRATIKELELVHSPEYVDLVRKLSDPVERRKISPGKIEAAGFAPGTPSPAQQAALLDAAQSGIVVVQCSRATGRVAPRRRLRETGIVAGEDLSPQKARILLALMLLTTSDIAAIQQAFQSY